MLPVHDGLRCAQRRQARAPLGLGLALSRPPPALQTYTPGPSPRTRPQPQASPVPIQACALPALPDRQLHRGAARAAAPPALVSPALVRGAPGRTGAAAGRAARAARAAAARLHRLLGRSKAGRPLGRNARGSCPRLMYPRRMYPGTELPTAHPTEYGFPDGRLGGNSRRGTSDVSSRFSYRVEREGCARYCRV